MWDGRTVESTGQTPGHRYDRGDRGKEVTKERREKQTDRASGVREDRTQEAVSGEGWGPQNPKSREKMRRLLGQDGRRCLRDREVEARPRIHFTECCEGA